MRVFQARTQCQVVVVLSALLVPLWDLCQAQLETGKVKSHAQSSSSSSSSSSAATAARLTWMAPADSVVLPNGSSVLISSIDEFIARTTEHPSTSSAIGPPKSRLGLDTGRGSESGIVIASPSTTVSSIIVGNMSKPIPQHWEVKNLLNVTLDFPLQYSQVIFGYIWPLMAGLTVFTNMMIVFVLTQRDMRTPTNVVLTAIAIVDIIPIIVPVPWFVYLFAMENEKKVLYPPLVCYLYQHSTRSVSEVFYFLSAWLNLLLAVQDYLTAARPKLAQKYCQIRVVVVEIVLLILLAFLLNLPQLLKLIFKPVKFIYRGQITWGCRGLQAKWFKNLVGEYVALYDDVFAAVIVIFVDGGPAIALITLTALLIRQLQKQRIQGHLLMEQARTASKRRRERHRQQEYEASARVMIFVLIAFLAFKIPFATTYTLIFVQSRFDIHFVDNLTDFQKAITITDLVFVLSYPINFTIFCCCSKKFRHKCIQLLAECHSSAAKSRLMRSFSESLYSDTTSIANSQSKQLKHGSVASSTVLAPNSLCQRDDSLASQAVIKQLTEINTRIYSSPICAAHNSHLADRERSAELDNSPDSNAMDEQDLELIAAEGKLCLECIKRYEQIKRSPSAGSARRESDSSQMSWPTPPALHFAAQYSRLPQIITTRCESVPEESPKDPREDYMGQKDASQAGSGKTQARLHQHQSPGASSTRFSSDPGTNWPQMDLRRERRSSGDDEHQRLDGSSGSGLTKPSQRRHLASSSSSDSQKLSPNNRKPARLSLSLSNSKLSTLPNATGLLADILITSLIGDDNPGNSKKKDTGEGKLSRSLRQ